MIYDFCVIGGGIVGLATAYELSLRKPGASILILEKENELAKHQTGHNSGVIHAGVYYTPGSLKATLCKRGAEMTKAFCQAHAIPFEVCGKLLVATNALELARMDNLFKRAIENELEITRVSQSELAVLEPNIVGLGALKVASTGIVNYKTICQKLAEILVKKGADLRLGVAVTHIREELSNVQIESELQRWEAKQLIVCGGLQSDRLAKLAGLEIDHQIVPFRGEYYQLPAHLNGLVKHLIYPIPDPELPFLGVHLTKMIDGSITVGPNAVLGFAREGYKKMSMNLKDIRDFALFPGFWRVIASNLRSGLTEMKNSYWKAGYLELCRKYCPSLKLEDLLPYEAGIRAQAVMRNGELVHDFLFIQTSRMLHVCNAPSPAATSALPIGEMIVDKLEGI